MRTTRGNYKKNDFEYSFKEIAIALNLTEKQVRVLYVSALKKISLVLNEDVIAWH